MNRNGFFYGNCNHRFKVATLTSHLAEFILNSTFVALIIVALVLAGYTLIIVDITTTIISFIAMAVALDISQVYRHYLNRNIYY